MTMDTRTTIIFSIHQEGTIIDSNVDPIVARAYSSSLILDSNGQPIDGRVILLGKGGHIEMKITDYQKVRQLDESTSS